MRWAAKASAGEGAEVAGASREPARLWVGGSSVAVTFIVWTGQELFIAQTPAPACSCRGRRRREGKEGLTSTVLPLKVQADGFLEALPPLPPGFPSGASRLFLARA